MTAYPVPGNAGHWWLATSYRLHAVPAGAVTWEQIEAAQDRGEGSPCTTACGVLLPLRYGGVGDRFEMRRCEGCCHRLGVPYGRGTPVNEATVAEQAGQQ